MGERQSQASRFGGLRNGVGEIVEVQGGHIVRSTGRKDRHSKVCTAKGPRDRRVRLSAHTAIQFYDVQDRLGYDRPSKAVDWLIKKAKAAIDELAELPPWNPETTMANCKTKTSTATTTNTNTTTPANNQNDREFDFSMNAEEDVQNLQMNHHHHHNHHQGSSFLPPSLDSDSIADTIKSFFPMGASNETPSSSIQFQSCYPPDLLSRTTTSHSQDLRLSLQSFQEPNSMLLHHQQQQQNNESVLFPGTTAPLGFDSSTAGWSHESDHQHHSAEQLSRFQRLVAWNSSGGGADTGNSSGGGGGGGGGFMFNSPPQSHNHHPPLQPLFGQNQFFSQRGPLQSSNTPSVRAWIQQPITLTNHIPQHSIHQSLISSVGFASAVGEFSGFRIPARIQGEDEEHDVAIHNRPSSASSDSRH